MIPTPDPIRRAHARRVRAAAAACAALVALALALGSCTTDGDSPLGRDLGPGRLGADPGDVITAELSVSGDSVFTLPSMLDGADTLYVGAVHGYRFAAVIVSSFGSVSSSNVASPYISVSNSGTAVPVTVHRLATAWREGQSLSSLDTLPAIPDDQGQRVRLLASSQSKLTLPQDSVRAWIDSAMTAAVLAIVYAGTGQSDLAMIESRTGENATRIRYTGTKGLETFATTDDGNFVEALASASVPTISSGYVRYLHVDLPLDSLPDSAMVNTAVLRMHVVPGSVWPASGGVIESFVPDATDPASSAFRTGALFTRVSFDGSTSVAEIPVTFQLRGMLDESFKRNGITLRLLDERSAVRQVAFYGSSAPDSLRPSLRLVATQPARWSK